MKQLLSIIGAVLLTVPAMVAGPMPAPGIAALTGPSMAAPLDPSMAAPMVPALAAPMAPAMSAPLAPSMAAPLLPNMTVPTTPSMAAPMMPNPVPNASPNLAAPMTPGITGPRASSVPSPAPSALLPPGMATLGGGQAPWTIVILLTLLTLIPALMMSMTPFVRILIVFHFLRQALGTQSTPTNQTLIGLALVLTCFLMQPVGVAIQQQAIVPLEAGKITPMAAVEIGAKPLKTFMLHYVRQKDVALFLELAKEPRPATPEDLSMRVVVPSYILSELKAGFQIGAVLFLPFLVIDMVVASITTSVGMMQLPPVVISTPLKLLLFVMVDGWNLLVGSLMRSFA